ncbi:DUF4185 domain-containing protein [Mycobacterium sp. NPDC050853]|uniref:DUF4185 domain-containing protein n=1 Tax=Mycobacterium sp. NPDC050853 TaxID=3155160 RepID=UPI0033CA58DE
MASFAVGSALVVGAVAALHNLYRSGDGAAELVGWSGLLLLGMTALGGGVKLVLWGARPVTAAVSDAVKGRCSESVRAVIAALGVVAGSLAMWWVFRGGYTSWWQNLTGESQWSLSLGVGQMLVAVAAGAALFTGGKYLTGLAREALTESGLLVERDRPAGKAGAQEALWHPGLVAALVGGGLGLVLLTAGVTPRLYVWITDPDVFPAVGAIAFVLLWAVCSNLGWWKGLGGLWKWATDASQKTAATAGVVAVLMFSAGGLGLGWFTPATVPQAHAACPPDCGGPGGSDGPPGGGQMFQPPSQGGPQMPDYQGSNSRYPSLDQNNGVSIYNQQAGQGATSNNAGSPQQGVQPGQNADGSWQRAANGEQMPNYQNATPFTQGPGAPNPDYQGGQANPGSQGGQPNQGVQQPAQQPQQAPQNQPPGQNSGQQPNQSDQQKIDDLTRQLQDQQTQTGQDRQRLDDLTKQLQQNKSNQKQQQLPKFPSKDDKKDRDQQEQQDRDKQSGDNDLVALLMGAASTRRRKQDEQEQGPDTKALGQDASQVAQGLPGDVQTYVQSGQGIAQSSGQAAQGFGSAAQAGASLASSAQSGAVNPQDAITLVQGVSQGIQGTADAVNSGSQIVKTAQKEADQAAQAVGDVNPQLKPQMEQITKLNDQASQVTDMVGQGAQLTSQGAGAVNTVSSMGSGGLPDTSGTAEAMSGPAGQATDAAAQAQSVELMSGTAPDPGDPSTVVPAEPAAPARGQAINLGPVAGTDSPTGAIGAGGTDLTEIAPSGQVGLAGDTFAGPGAYKGDWSPSMGLHVKPGTLDDTTKGVQFDRSFGAKDSLYADKMIPGAGHSQLPAGTINVNGTDYAMIDNVVDLKPIDSRLVKIDPNGGGWTSVAGSTRPGDYLGGTQSQFSGYQSSDGNVYMLSDGFARDQGLSLWKAGPSTFTDRSTWQAWGLQPDGSMGWLPAGQQGAPISNGQTYGEFSMREIEGKTVLSGFNSTPGMGQVEVLVANSPAELFTNGVKTVIATQQTVPQNYGGYIVPGSTLDSMRILVSQWNTKANTPYNVQEFVANVNR